MEPREPAASLHSCSNVRLLSETPELEASRVSNPCRGEHASLRRFMRLICAFDPPPPTPRWVTNTVATRALTAPQLDPPSHPAFLPIWLNRSTRQRRSWLRRSGASMVSEGKSHVWRRKRRRGDSVRKDAGGSPLRAAAACVWRGGQDAPLLARLGSDRLL